MLFLGGKEKTTLKEISELLGKETIDLDNTSENRGREKSHGINHQKMGKELMTQDELAVMSNAKCILQLRGERPFLSDKYDITKHPNYEFLSDFDPKLVFDIEKELSIKLKLGKSQITDVYDIGSVEEELENSRT
jgi:type IV secretion system protein VirD4